MGGLALVLLLLSAAVQWWPTSQTGPNDAPFRDRPSDRITMREIQATSHSEKLTPPPPAPLPPVVVPNETLVEQTIDIGESDLQLETDGEDERLQEGTQKATASRRPDVEARLLRNVQPNYPAAARSENVHARIEVEVEIEESGRVTNATVRRRWRLSDGGSSRPVAKLGYGLEEAALHAAQRSLFRPARKKGNTVSSRKIITFTFGPE